MSYVENVVCFTAPCRNSETPAPARNPLFVAAAVGIGVGRGQVCRGDGMMRKSRWHGKAERYKGMQGAEGKRGNARGSGGERRQGQGPEEALGRDTL